MTADQAPWVAILIVAVVTFFSRAAGPIVMKHIEISAKVERFLNAMSLSVVAALVASLLAQGGVRELTAVGIAIALMVRTRSAIWAMVAGIGAAALWSAVTL